MGQALLRKAAGLILINAMRAIARVNAAEVR